MQEHLKAVVSRNMRLMREVLTDGWLVKQGLVDAAKLQECLSGRPTRLKGHMTQLYSYLNTEAWIRSWLGPA
jgi:hypothetical protein